MKKTFFIIGLGKMGGNIAIQASEKNLLYMDMTTRAWIIPLRKKE